MALTPSNMIPLGTKAPNFTLLDTVSGKLMSLDQLKAEHGTVIMFICNHCPFVQHLQEGLVTIAQKYQAKGIQFIAISSNDTTIYPEDAPDKMKEMAEQFGYPFPYLFDETQAVAKAYDAACTPDFYIFDQNLLCVYRGRFDESTPGKGMPVTGNDLSSALDQLLENEPIDPDQKPSYGCNIKWTKRD